MSYRISIDEPRPWREVLRLLLAVAVVLLLMFASYALGQYRGEQAGGIVSEKRALRLAVSDMLLGQVAQLEERNRSLKGEVALAEQNSQISDESVNTVRGELLTMETELQEAKKLLDFYTGIVAPADARGGLRLHEFTLKQATHRAYSYKLVLIQTKNHGRMQLGKASFEVHGILYDSDEPVVLKMKDVTYPEKDSERYGFRYFQEFSGDIAVPSNFLPTRLKLTVKPSQRGGKTLERVYDWSSLMTAG